MTLPDRQAATTGQPAYQPEPMPGWPTETAAPLVPVDGRRVVGYERHAGMLLPVYEAPPAPTRVETVVVQRGIDPRAQVMAAGGILAAGTGLGIDLALSPMAGIGTGGLMWLAIAVVAMRIGPTVARGGTRIHQETHVHNTNRWLGRSTTNTHQR